MRERALREAEAARIVSVNSISSRCDLSDWCPTSATQAQEMREKEEGQRKRDEAATPESDEAAAHERDQR